MHDFLKKFFQRFKVCGIYFMPNKTKSYVETSVLFVDNVVNKNSVCPN